MMNEDKIIYRWKPMVRTDKLIKEDCAEEYAIVADDNANAGIIVYGKYRGKWLANPFNMRHLIAHLLCDKVV